MIIVDITLQDELKAGSCRASTKNQDICPPVYVSHFRILTKNTDKMHGGELIVDSSAPDTLNVKDGISPELCSLEYTKISDVIAEPNKMGPGTLLAKIDIKSPIASFRYTQ